MKDYNKTLWEDNITLVDARKLNNIEEQVDSITDKILEVESNLNKNTDAIEQACTAITGERFNSIDERIDSEIDRLNKKIEVSMIKQQNKEKYAVVNSIQGVTTNMKIKGQTLQNIVKMSDFGLGDIGILENNVFKVNRTSSSKATALAVGKNFIIGFKPNTEYTVMALIENNNLNREFALIHQYQNTMFTKNAIMIPQGFNGIISKKFTTIDNINLGDRLEINFQLATGTVDIKNLIILEGDYTNTYFDRYFEGIISIGEYEYNYLDKSQISLGYIGGNNGITYTIPPRDDGTRTAIIPCEPNTVYTITKENLTDRFVIGTTSEKPIHGMNIRRLSDLCNKSVTITTPEDAKYLLAYLTINIREKDFGKVSISKGFFTNWNEPNQHNIKILSNNKNLFNNYKNINSASADVFNIENDNVFMSIKSSNAWANSTINYGKLEMGQKYTISCEGYSGGVDDYVLFAVKKFKNGIEVGSYGDITKNSKSRTFTIIDDCDVVLRFFLNNTTPITSHTEITFKNLQLEKGDRTNYEPSKMDKKVIVMKEPLRKNDYIYEDNNIIKIHKESNVVDFKNITINVSEISNRPDAKSTNWFQTNFIPQLKNAKKSTLNFNNKFVGVDAETSWKDINDFECLSIAVQEGGVRLQGRIKKGITLNELNQKLKGLIICYQTSTPIIEVIKECNTLNLKTYNEKTYIDFQNAFNNINSFNIPVDTKETLSTLKKENEDIKAILNSILESLNKK